MEPKLLSGDYLFENKYATVHLGLEQKRFNIRSEIKLCSIGEELEYKSGASNLVLEATNFAIKHIYG